MRVLRLKERSKRRGEEVGTHEEGSKPKAAQRPDRELYRVGGRRLSATIAPTIRERGNEEKPRERKRRRSKSRTPGEREKSRSPGRERRRHRKRSRSGERKRSGSRNGKHREHRSGRHHSEKERDSDRHKDRDREKVKDKPSDRKDRSSDTKHHTSHHRSPPRSKRQNDSDTDQDKSSRKRKKAEGNSPDPLDAIIGPAPPPRARGRGTTSGSSAMDARFSEQYDPAMDVQPDPDDGDDWDNALEAYRDRQKWKALGAERLRSAGFGEDFITAWENNDTKNTANIKWAKDGVREWDRGKVVEEETGEVTIKASWAKGGSGRDK